MVLLATLFFLQSAGWVGSMPGAGAPENITVEFLNPTSVKVSWATTAESVDKYDVTYKPTDASYRVVAVVAGNSEAVTLNGLLADTQYQVTVTAVRGGKKYRSGPIVFRTMVADLRSHKRGRARSRGRGVTGGRGPAESPRSSPQQDGGAATAGPAPEQAPGEEAAAPAGPPPYVQVRGVEVGIVLLVLVVWAAAIALFFNRWGKIRMLLPYQPDYKEQLKVPGGGACAASGGACPAQQHVPGAACPQHHHWSAHHFEFDKWPRTAMLRPVTRPRVNSAIYISSAHAADSEFVRLEPFRADQCRRARSAEDIPLSGLPALAVSRASPPEQRADRRM